MTEKPYKPQDNKSFSRANEVVTMNKLYRFMLICLLLCGWVISQPGCTAAAGVEIRCLSPELTLYQGEKAIVTFEIVNSLKESLRPGGNYFISYHLSDPEGKILSYDNPRFLLPGVIWRKTTTRLEVPLFFGYSAPGNYIVEFDIVKEGEFWGSARGWQTAKTNLHLKPLFSAEFKERYLDYLCDTGNPLLNKEQHLLRLTLKNSEIIDAEGEIFGFFAGSTYPGVWIRDTATLVAYAQKVYPPEVLTRGVELFMEYQAPDGEVVDWVDLQRNTGKNTVETDQESSLLLAAYEIGKENPPWLRKTIKGKTVLERLEMALDWVWKYRRHQDYQLITSGFTADWGDTENTYPDQRATRLSDRSTMVLAIYTQAKYIQALDRFITILKEADRSRYQEKIKLWEERRQLIISRTRTHLYLEDKGYFITHLVPTADREKFFDMEKEILAVGGNAEAIIAGLMDQEQVKRFIAVLEERRRQYRLRTVSFTLIPPYPEGFFPHHLLKHPWNYQNGGEWDWIGGRVVKALFLEGFAKEAEEYLLEIVKKNLANFCLYEWEDRSGTGRGALFYVGAAGVIGEAILTGYQDKQAKATN